MRSEKDEKSHLTRLVLHVQRAHDLGVAHDRARGNAAERALSGKLCGTRMSTDEAWHQNTSGGKTNATADSKKRKEKCVAPFCTAPTSFKEAPRHPAGPLGIPWLLVPFVGCRGRRRALCSAAPDAERHSEKKGSENACGNQAHVATRWTVCVCDFPPNPPVGGGHDRRATDGTRRPRTIGDAAVR